MTDPQVVADDPLELRPLAAEGVDLLAGIAERGDPVTYQEVQLLLLTSTPKHGPDDGPEVDHPDQEPGPLPDGLLELEEAADEQP